MPIYEYECKKCACRFEVRHSYHDKPDVECPTDGCDGPIRRVFSPPAIIFKGSGFHVNDYGPSTRKEPAAESSTEQSESSSEAAKTGTE